MQIFDGKAEGKVRYNSPYLGIVSIISVIYLAYYLWWRASSTLNPQAPFFSWALLLAEAFGAFSYMLFQRQEVRA